MNMEEMNMEELDMDEATVEIITKTTTALTYYKAWRIAKETGGEATALAIENELKKMGEW